MPQQNLISVSMDDKDVAEINAAISVLKEKLLPRLRALNPDERRELPKMGDKTVAFVQKALEHCSANPELAPQFLDTSEFGKDMNAVESLRCFHAPLEQIVEGLNDTMLLAGSDAYAAALMFYNTVKTAKNSNIAKAGVIYDDLSARFPGRPSKAAAAVKN